MGTGRIQRGLSRLAWALAFAQALGLASNAAETATLAGTGAPGYSGDGAAAAEAALNNPFGVVRGPDGAVYFCDTGNHIIRRIGRDGVIETVAGCGESGYSGDGGPAREAHLNEPYEVRFAPGGALVFVEMQNHVVRQVDPVSGTITTLAGTGTEGFSGDGGPALEARLKQPHSIQFDRDGALYICDIGNHRIRRVDPKNGTIDTFCGNGRRDPTVDDSPASGETPLNGPRALDIDRKGDLWLALREGNAVYRIDMENRRLRHVAGTGRSGFTGNGGPAREAALSGPKGISVAPDGNIYFADTESHSIRFIDFSVSPPRMQLLAGDGERGDGTDGRAEDCRFARPHGIFVERDGSVLVGDSENHRLRVIRPKDVAVRSSP